MGQRGNRWEGRIEKEYFFRCQSESLRFIYADTVSGLAYRRAKCHGNGGNKKPSTERGAELKQMVLYLYLAILDYFGVEFAY